ncbi:MAG: beta strand repeat-containing protein [Candidatus Spyradosoma sp.]
MKTSKLFITSLLAAAAALSVPAFGATATLTSTTTTISESDAATYGIAAGTYSGNIIELTAAGSTGFHDGTFTIYNTDASGTISTTTGVVGTTSTALTNGGTAGAAQALWNYFVGSPSQLSSNYTYGETLYVSANTLSSGDLTANMTFGPAALGGLVVGASDNTFETGRTNGDIQMQFAGASGSGVVFNIASNTKLHAENGFVASGNQDWTIASGKTLSLLKKGDGGGTLTLNENCSMGVSGGGALSVGGIVVSSGATLTIGTDTTLDLSGARVTLASAMTNSGTVTLSGTTVFALDNLTATNGTYSLITGNSVTDVSGVSFMRDGFAIKSSRLSVSTASGYAVTVTNYSDLVWAGTAENSAWNTTAENWSSTAAGGSVAFENRDSVTFGADAGVSKTVSVASVVVANSVAVSDNYEFAFSNNGSVTASTMSIADGKTLTLSGTGSLTTGAVSGGGNLTVGAGVEATFTGTNTFTGTATVNGTAILSNSSDLAYLGTGDIVGSGDIRLKVKDEFDASRLSNFSGTLVLAEGNRMCFTSASASALGNLSIRVESGRQLFLDGWSSDNRANSFSNALTIAGAGYGTTASDQAALRLHETSTLSGLLTLSSDATVYVQGGTNTISGGISAAGKTLTIDGADTLNISGTANITIGTLTLKKSGNTNLSATGTTTITTLNQSAGTLTIGGATTVTGDYQGGNTNNGTSTLTIDAGAVMSVTGEMRGRHEYAGTSTVNVNGELSVGGNFWIARDGKGIVNVNDGGTVVANTLTFGQAWNGASTKGSTVNLEEGGTLVVGTVVANTTAVGASTPALNASALNLNGGTLGTSADSMTIDVKSGSTALSVVLGTGTTSTINTGKYDTATKTFTDAGSAISIANVISGDGALKKAGAGTLTLSGANIYMGGTTIEAGTLVAGNASALGTGNVVVADGATLKYGASSGAVSIGGTLTTNGAALLDLSASDGSSAAFAVTGAVALSGDTLFNVAVAPTSVVTLLSTGSTLTVDSTAVSSGTVSALGISNLYVGGFLANQRDGASATFSVTNGVLTLDSCTVGTTNYSLSWNGGADGVWKANGSGWQTVADSPAAETFQTGDTVTFTDVSAGTGTVTVDGRVSVAAMTIDSTSNYTFTAGQNGTAIAGTGALTKRGTGTATIDASVDLSGIAGGITVEADGGKLVVDTASGYAGAVTAGENGTFSLNVSSDTTLANTLSGAGTFEKTGAGTLILSRDNTSFTGKLLVAGGTVKLGSATGMGAESVSVEVATGGMLDLQGYTDNKNYGNYVLSGGALVNNRTGIGSGKKQLAGGITLKADSEVGGSSNFGMVSGGFAKNTLTLNGHTLTKTGSNTFWLTATTVTAGTIDVREGALSLRNGPSSAFSMEPDAWIKLNGGTITVGKDGNNSGTVALGNVAIVFNDANKDTGRISADSGCKFTVESSAVLRLDIGALTAATLTPGENVSLTIAAASAIANDSFFSAVEVGTYNEAGSWVKDLQWAYVEGSWNVGAGTLSIAIPEPSVFGLLAGLGALALAGTRRRRKKA